MKYILIIWFVIFFTSCEKDSSSPDLKAAIEYKVNGNSVLIDNAGDQYVIFQKQLKGSLVSETRYLLNAQKGANNVLMFGIVSDSLQTKSYHYDSTSANLLLSLPTINYDGQVSSVMRKGDYFDITISDYSNSRISGTFTAKLTATNNAVSGPTGTTVITEGKINNVQVVY